jgi:photosystem II stability/assembly factor-like uncharacterized protein
MSVDRRRQWHALSRQLATILIASAVVAAVALPAWRSKSPNSVLGAATIATEQVAGRWIPFAAAPLASQSAPNIFHSGRISSIAVDPRDSRRWLLGVGNGGVWETRDAGETWTPIADDAPTLATGAIAFAPGNQNVIYVGTGEGIPFSGHTRVGFGLLTSTNNGQTWSLSGQKSLAGTGVRRIRIDPADTNTVLVVATRSSWGRDSGVISGPAAPAYGVLRSTDGGVNWTQTLPGIGSALEVHPTNFSRQYAGIAIGSSQNGLFRSTNGGVSWSRIDGPWWPNPLDTNAANGQIELAIAPSNPDIMYAGFSESISSPRRGNLLGLFRTDNAWADTPTWIQIPVQATGPGGYCGNNGCESTHVISVDPQNADTLYAGGVLDLWRCTNCGASPTWTTTPRTHADFHELAWAGNRLIMGNDGGVWSTLDRGATWLSHNRLLRTLMFFSGALHPRDPSFVVGGLRDFPLTVYGPSTGWRNLGQASTAEWGEGDVAVSSSHPDTDWMVGWLHGVIQRTTDGGRTSLQVDGAIDKTGAATVAPTRKCPADDNVFLAGTNRVWRTNNFFSSTMPSWTINSQTSDQSSILGITFIESDRSCNTYAYGTRSGVVRLTNDGGATWIDLDPSKTLPERPINSLAFDPTNRNRAYLAISSYDVATPAKPGHIFRTDNALSSSPTWLRVGPPDQPFADVPFNVIAIDPRNPQIVYAGSDNGLWESSDGGNAWAKIGLGSGLPPATVHDIQINPTTNKTVVFTYGRGAFELMR